MTLSLSIIYLIVTTYIHQVHRQLLAAVGEGEREVLPGNTQLEELTHHMNTKHRVSWVIEQCIAQLPGHVLWEGNKTVTGEAGVGNIFLSVSECEPE